MPGRKAELLRSGVAIFDLDYDAILSAMYALSASAEGDCYRCAPPDPGIEAAALGASESSLPDTAPGEALHTFMLNSGDPSGGPVVARSSTVLPCPAVPSGSLSGLHLPSFSTSLVSTTALQDAMVTTTTPGGQRVSICTCTRTGRHLATFTRRPGSSLYTLATKPPQVAASAQVSTSLPPLPPSPAPPCLPCVEGRQCAAPHSSSFPPTTAPLETLHMDVSGPARVSGQGRERYFLLVVDDYTRYTTVFHLRSKGQVVDVLIPSIRAVRLQLCERFRQDLPVLRMHSDRGGEFSSDLLRDFCRGEGILQSFTLPDSPQQNGIAERRIGLVMEVAPHFLWPSAVRYAAHQLNLWPRVSLLETTPTLRRRGKVRDVSVFWVWGSRAFVCNTSADMLSTRAISCVFLDFSPDVPGWQFYHPTSRRGFPSHDVTFDESIPFYRLFPYRSAPPPPPPLFLAPGPPLVDPLPPQGRAPSDVSQVDPLPGNPGGAESEGAGCGVAEPAGVEPGGAEPEGAESGGAEPRGAALSGGPAGASPSLSPRPETLSPQQLREWLVRRARLQSGATGAGGTGNAGAGGAGVTAGAGGTGGTAAAGPGGARTRGSGAAGTGVVGGAGAGGGEAVGAGAGGTGVGGAGAGGAGAVDPGARGARGTVRPRPYFVPLLQQPASPLLAPSPYTEQTGGLTERREPASRPASPVRTGRRVPRSRPPPVPGTHAMARRPSSVPLHVPLPPPPESSLPAVPDTEFDRARVASPTVSRLLATVVTGPSFESTATSALVAELLDFAAACRLDCATALVTESESASPSSVGGSPPAFKARYVARGFSQRQGVDYLQTFSPTLKMTTLWVLLHITAHRDYELHSGLQHSFLAGQPARGDLAAPPTWLHWVFSCRTTLTALGFTPSTADPSLFLRTNTSLPPFYILVYVDDLVFATADTEALTLVKSELQKRHTCIELGELRSYLGLQITRDRARRTITLTQSHMVHQVLHHFGFQFSSPQPTPWSTGHSLSAPPSDESVEPSGLYPELVGCLCYVMLSFAFTSVCLPSYVRVLHAWCERMQEFILGVVWIF
ncbi:unnamed protein product [Closterium sp. NIES-54]